MKKKCNNVSQIMGKYWNEYRLPSVINWFSNGTLKGLFNDHGFELIAKGSPSKKIRIKQGLSPFTESTPKFILKKELMTYFNRILGKYTFNYPPFDVKLHLFQNNNK